MSLTGTRKDPFLLHDSLPLNNIRRVHIPSSYFSPILSHSLSFFLNLLDSPLNSSPLVAEKKIQLKCKILIHLSAR